MMKLKHFFKKFLMCIIYNRLSKYDNTIKYIEEPKDVKPTLSNTKGEIITYLELHNIEYKKNDTKNNLLSSCYEKN